MKRFTLGAGLAALAFTALCAFLLRGKPHDLTGSAAAPITASSPGDRSFLARYFRAVWEAESGQARVH
jgi:hypothetical protein